MIGSRRDGVEHLTDLEPGEYARRSPGMVWLCLPNGEHCALPVTGDGWGVTEELDGTLTLSPSIALTKPGQPEQDWHGWLQAGVWTEA